MPYEIRIERNEMIDGAIAVIDEQGAAALSARSLARKLGISTQPIYREFGDMDGVRQAALDRALSIFSEYLKGEAIDQSVKYVRFAGERPRLFAFIFRGKQFEYGGLDDLSHKLLDGTDIIDRLQAITGLPREKVYRVHLIVWMAIHGLALYSCENRVALGTAELEQFTMDVTRGMTGLYRESE